MVNGKVRVDLELRQRQQWAAQRHHENWQVAQAISQVYMNDRPHPVLESPRPTRQFETACLDYDETMILLHHNQLLVEEHQPPAVYDHQIKNVKVQLLQVENLPVCVLLLILEAQVELVSEKFSPLPPPLPHSVFHFT